MSQRRRNPERKQELFCQPKLNVCGQLAENTFEADKPVGTFWIAPGLPFFRT